MRVLGVVTARGGSKGIPKKNLCLLAEIPLLQYTAEAARAASGLTRVILSTDDPEIAEAGRRLGFDVPFLRPVELARDDTPSIPVIQHAVRYLQRCADAYDAVFVLQPTNPLRRPADIDGPIKLLQRTGADSVISVTDVGHHHPARMKIVNLDGRVTNPPFAEEYEGQPRQLLPKFYLRDGSVYLTRTDVLIEQNSLAGDHCQAWIVPRERACSIDTPWDLLLAEQILARQARPAYEADGIA